MADDDALTLKQLETLLRRQVDRLNDLSCRFEAFRELVQQRTGITEEEFLRVYAEALAAWTETYEKRIREATEALRAESHRRMLEGFDSKPQ